MPKLLKHKSITLLLITTFFMVGMFLAYYIAPKIVSNKFSDIIPQDTKISTFEPSTTGQQQRELEDLELLFSTEEYFGRSWNEQERLIELEISSTSPLEGLVRRPVKHLTTNVSQIDCPEGSVVAVNEALEVTGRGFELEDRLDKGDTLWAYCIDKTCTSVGKKCFVRENQLTLVWPNSVIYMYRFLHELFRL